MRAFISHCGQNSANEAARAGVPILGLPLFNDQLMNAITLRHKGMARILDARSIRNANDEAASDQIADALNDVSQISVVNIKFI